MSLISTMRTAPGRGLLRGTCANCKKDVYESKWILDDAYNVWVTDASRGPVTSGLSGAVVDGGQRLALAASPSRGGLTVQAEGAGTRPVTVEITVEDHSISLPFQAGGAAGDGHADHTH